MDRQIWITGTPGGSRRLLTRQAQAVLKHADVLIADEAIMKSADDLGVPKKAKRITLKADRIRSITDECLGDNIVILLPFDPADDPRLDEILRQTASLRPALIPGVGIRSLLSARSGIGLSDAYCVILKEETNLVKLLSEHEKLIIAGGSLNAFEKELKAAGLLGTEMYLLENPGGEEEQILNGNLREMFSHPIKENSLILLIRKDKNKGPAFKAHLDASFGKNELLLTSEVRSVLMTLLAPGFKERIYVIGAGIGDTAVLAALESAEGHVYAFERSEYANALSEDVVRRLGVRNLTIIGGEAPLSLGHLPEPDAALIIGCPGIHHELLQILQSRNPKVRIVIATKTVETAVRDLDLFAARGMDADMRILSVGGMTGVRASHKLLPQESWFILRADALGGSRMPGI